MWNPFRKKDQNDNQPDSSEQGRNRVQEEVDRLFQQGRSGEIEAALLAFDQSLLTYVEQQSWWHIYGLVAYEEKRYKDALERFEEAYRRFPDVALIRFSLGQEYIRIKNIDEGFELFRSAVFPEVPAQHALAEARYAYLWNRYDDALLFIRPFFGVYRQVGDLDDNHLFMQGLPFFDQWWSYLAAFSFLSGNLEELEWVSRFFGGYFRNCDTKLLEAELTAYRDDDTTPLIELLQERRVERQKIGMPSGYIDMILAVIKAHEATTLKAVENILATVELSDKDFPWLEDVRILAMAEAAHRFGPTVLEEEYISTFLEHQRLLFEPNIAFDCFLLHYQETLKDRVTTGKVGGLA